MKNFGRLLLVLLLTVLGCGQSLVQFRERTAPTVSFTDPASGAVDVATGTRVNAAFSEMMDATTITVATFTLTQAGSHVPATVTYAGTTATLTPTAPLATGTLFTATITAAAKDRSGDALAGEYVWTFTTGRSATNTPPTVTITDPANHAVAVPASTTVSVGFSEVMDATTLTSATFNLKQGTASVPGAVTCAGLTATFTPASALAVGMVFTATITTGAKDLAGEGLAASYVWSFTTSAGPGTAAPTVVMTDPADDATAVPTGTTVSAAFSEAMDPTTLSTTTFTLTRAAAAVPGAVTYSGLLVTFTPTTPLAANTTYMATITTGAKDLAGNALAAAYVWSFTAAPSTGTTAPAVTITDPADHATAVSTSATVRAGFSEAMDPTTLSTGSFTLAQGALAVPGAVAYRGLVATLTPTSALAGNTTYTATITTAAKDLAGNALAAAYVWTFTTAVAAGTTAPTVTITDPASDATGVPTNTTVSAGFSEVMASATISATTFTLTQGAVAVPAGVTYSGLTATLNPTTALMADTAYTATITTGAQDVAGNALAAAYVWTFTTAVAGSTTAPTVTITDPPSSATGVPVNTTVSAGFSEVMASATISATTFTLTQGAVAVPAGVIYSGLTATLNPTTALTADTAYTATITTGAQDVAGNALAADYVWSFTTSAAADTTPPTVRFTVPTSNANGVDVDTTVQVGFDKTMDCTTLNALTITVAQGAVAVVGAVTCSGTSATFTPLSPLAPNAAFTAIVTTGAKDLAGVALAANYVWGFTTSPILAVTFTNPAAGASAADVNTTIQAAFNEMMNCATLSTTTFTVVQAMPDAGAAGVAGTVTCVASTSTFTPTSELASATAFTATITTGVKDLAGNTLAVDYVWGFTTGTQRSAAVPTVTAVTPLNGAMGVAINAPVTATFDEPMNAATITGATFTVSQVVGDGGVTPIAGTVSLDATTHTVATFTPTASYPPSATMTATVTTGAQDGAGNGLYQNYVWAFQTGTQVGQGTIDLGAASTFAILSFNTVTNVNNVGTYVTGDIGIYPGTALVGFPPGVCNGSVDVDTPAAEAAETSLLAAYNDAVARAHPAALPGDISGLTFTPGLYANLSSVELSAGSVTLDAQGDADAVFIFQISTTLTTIGGTEVVLAGGAKATNIFWAVGTSATLGTTSIFKGTILAAIAITANTGAAVEGRLLTQAAAVSLDTNIITVPSP